MNTTTITLPEDQEIKREKEVKVRLTKEEHYVLREKAHKSGKQLAVYVREAALQKELKAQLTPDQIAVYIKFNKLYTSIKNNLEDLIEVMHKEKLEGYALKFDQFMKQIDEQLKNKL